MFGKRKKDVSKYLRANNADQMSGPLSCVRRRLLVQRPSDTNVIYGRSEAESEAGESLAGAKSLAAAARARPTKTKRVYRHPSLTSANGSAPSTAQIDGLQVKKVSEDPISIDYTLFWTGAPQAAETAIISLASARSAVQI